MAEGSPAPPQRPRTTRHVTRKHRDPALQLLGWAIAITVVFLGALAYHFRDKLPGMLGLEPSQPVATATAPQRAPVDDRLNRAQALLAQDPLSPEAEALLKELGGPQADELLKKIAADRAAAQAAAQRGAAQKRCSAILQEALDFETRNEKDAARMTDIAAKFRETAPLLKDAPELAAQAENKAAQWQQRYELKSALVPAFEARDFDKARQVCQDVIGRAAGPAVKTEAEAALATLEDAASTAFQSAQRKVQSAYADPARPMVLTLAAWDEYLKDLKDAAHRPQAEQARKAIADSIGELLKTCLAQAAQQARLYEYDKALEPVKKLAPQLAGSPQGEALRVRESELTLQRQLHETVVNRVKKVTENGPVPLPFPLVSPKMPRAKGWLLAGVKGQEVRLALTQPVIELGVKFSDLSAQDQYALCRGLFPNPTAADHRAFAAFCMERGLNDEAADHARRAGP